MFPKLKIFFIFFQNDFILDLATLYLLRYLYRVPSLIDWICKLTLLIMRIKIDYYGFEFLSI